MNDTPSRGKPQAPKRLLPREHPDHYNWDYTSGTFKLKDTHGETRSFPPIRRSDLPADTFLSRLKALGERISGTGPTWRACCPAHDDYKPSLSVTETKEGILLIRCFAGCETEAILEKLDLSLSHLFPSLYALQSGERRPQGSLSFRGAEGARDCPVAEPTDEQCEEWARRLKGWPMPRYALNQLAVHLDLPREALVLLNVGYNEDDKFGPCWVFPERDDRRRVVGLVRRYSRGVKYAVEGSMRGLSIPHWGKKPPPGPIHLVEGASDVAALVSQGVFAVGRFNAEGSAAERLWLSRLLARYPKREVIVVGEREEGGVGRRGASKRI